MTDGARVLPVSAGSCAASCLNGVRQALLLLWQGVNCSQLVRATASPPVFVCRRALRITRVRGARPAMQQSTVPALLCGCSASGVQFPRARDARTRDDRRAHTHAPPLSRLHCPTAPKLSAAQHTTRAAPPATTAGCTSAMRGWRSPVDAVPSKIIMRFMERRGARAFAASRWVSRLKRHRSSRRGTSPPPVRGLLCRTAAGSLRCSGGAPRIRCGQVLAAVE
jgi:hypothetical protein